MIKFTIITCTYNASDVLRRTLESVMEQDYISVEHLIIDGKSKDNSVLISKRYKEDNDTANTGHEVIISSEPDMGLYDAMNKGIARATGDYLVFLNAGDCFHSKDTLSYVASCVGENEVLPAVLYGDTDIVDDNGNFIRPRRLVPPEKLSWRSFRNGMLVCHQSFYARADIAKTILYDFASYRLSADVDWCIRIMKEGQKRGLPLRRVHAVLTDYLDGGMSVKNHKASLKERFMVMRKHYGLITTIVMHCFFIFRAVIKK